MRKIFTQRWVWLVVIFAVLWVLAEVRRWQDRTDFETLTNRFNASRSSGISKVEILPIETSFMKLTRQITIVDPQMNASILQQITFSDSPELPKAMEHSGAEAECEMLVHFNNGANFCFYVCFRDGPAGGGVEYAISPDSNLNDNFESRLPGNYTLGRGYSVQLSSLLRRAISDSGNGSHNDESRTPNTVRESN